MTILRAENMDHELVVWDGEGDGSCIICAEIDGDGLKYDEDALASKVAAAIAKAINDAQIDPEKLREELRDA